MLVLDDVDRKIISLLSKISELSQSQIAEIVKISQPSVGARVRKLKNQGLHAHVRKIFKTY